MRYTKDVPYRRTVQTGPNSADGIQITKIIPMRKYLVKVEVFIEGNGKLEGSKAEASIFSRETCQWNTLLTHSMTESLQVLSGLNSNRAETREAVASDIVQNLTEDANDIVETLYAL